MNDELNQLLKEKFPNHFFNPVNLLIR